MKTLTQAATELRLTLSEQAKVEFDLIVIGGGITGARIFHQAAAQGIKVLLLEQQDFAWGTSSRSSKMVHGGLRYLASGQWRMTRDAARERENLLSELPGLVELMPYLMLHQQGDFPPAPLFHRVLSVYDKLAGTQYHKPVTLERAASWLPEFSFENVAGVSLFADGVTDDARLVLRSLQDGVLAGGVALNYAKAVCLLEDKTGVTGVEVTLDGGKSCHQLNAKCVINATGSWADKLHPLNKGELRPLRGSHLVLPFARLPVSACITFFHPKDRRPVYVYPWQGCSVIGTTDLDHRRSLDEEPGISHQEVEYLLSLANHYFPQLAIDEDDVISCWSGIRPIVTQGKSQTPSKESREHMIWSKAGLISVTGGKLTSSELMARETLEEVKKQYPTLIGQISNASFSQLTQGYADKRLKGYFGHFAADVSSMQNDDTLGVSQCQWRELEWSLQSESVAHLDDLLLRRTRLALILGEEIELYRAKLLCLCQRVLSWSDEQANSEWQRFKSIFNDSYQLPIKTTEQAKGIGI
ncbi:glycerol-3-phosphate dehydrogenase/oxidase [Shewanella sp. UCD-KL12]|uniref:glycerol-3-phosphate dehydrogenase/oxidase n=1 Tax=Shewanella sp. UCD-KL12 TaxID=1917163 RepID=UPI0009FA4EF8|nr:glycerol-3-phosphate dehydrogenase/oxidase [Shewanella sp. UCD-KL12]